MCYTKKFCYIVNELDNIIQDYLKATDTDYAIMINGDCGAGNRTILSTIFRMWSLLWSVLSWKRAELIN